MNRFSKISIVVLSLALLGSLFFPIWKIDLIAPQYPEGLGMKIWINKLSGNIDTINGLNHYIGMKHIDAASIPELKYMPYLLVFIVIAGLVAAAIGRKWSLYVWVFLFACLGVIGGFDFYKWEYDYGHNLDPRAAIKIPGMSYQPPLLGTKQLLNFTAQSFPDAGGVIILLAGALAIGLVVYNLFFQKSSGVSHDFREYKKASYGSLMVIAGCLLFSGCSAGPEKLDYGKDYCSFCKMGIADQRFGAELVTGKGKIYKFDAIECMVKFKDAYGDDKAGEFRYVLVEDAAGKKNLVDAASAFYLRSAHLPSPMGANLSAYAAREDAEKFRDEYPGILMEWKDAERIILSGHE